MIATIATPNQIMVCVMLSWVWVSVAMEFAPSFWAGTAGLGVPGFLGDPLLLDFRLISGIWQNFDFA
jgi:hypothetical protein